MQTISETSYGIIPLTMKDGVLQVFLIHQIGRTGQTFWTFPKGHVEGSEEPQETALRELTEETGLTAVVDPETKAYTQKYSFTDGMHTFEKSVLYFIGWVHDSKAHLQSPEVLEGRWCHLSEAEKLLTHDQTREILKDVEAVCTIVPHRG